MTRRGGAMFSLREAAALIPSATVVGDDGVTFEHVSTDSRTAGPGDLFVALKGDRFDAHDFLPDVAARQAQELVVSEHVTYKGMMLDGVPNMAFAIGYTNASWTLKVDLVASYVTRMLGFMRQRGYVTVTPRVPAGGLATSPLIDMSSGYFERARHLLPLQGDRVPWRLHQHYFKDAAMYRGPVDEQNLDFAAAPALSPAAG